MKNNNLIEMLTIYHLSRIPKLSASASIVLSLFSFSMTFGQGAVGIGTAAPHESAILEVSSPSGNQGLLLPRVNGIDLIKKPSAEGLVVYDESEETIAVKTATNSDDDDWLVLHPIPRGGIIMWSGDEATIPNGWALCNGNWYNPEDNTDNGTSATTTRTVRAPDLEGRFIVGYDPNENDYDDPGNLSTRNPNGTLVGNKGGEASVVLTANQSGLSAHNHNMTHSHGVTDPGHFHEINELGREQVDDSNQQNSWNRNNTAYHPTEESLTGITINSYSGATANNTASNAILAHENRPPYYVLAFIIKL